MLKKGSGWQSTIHFRTAVKKPKWFILSLFGMLVTILLYYTLTQQLFTSVPVKVVDIYLNFRC